VSEILREIVQRRRSRVGTPLSQGRVSGSFPQARLLTAGDNAFLGALYARRGRAVIAEVKLGSPRLGSLQGRIDPEAVARAYAANGAAALSVVVEPDFFHGSYELLAACKKASGLPAIAKDFVVDPAQLEWAKQAGADAVLLVAALYNRGEIAAYAALARGLGLVPLIETHSLADLETIDGRLWELVGVNNRDLRTFEVELGNSIALLPSLPPAAVKVSESGIESAADLALLRGAGFDAFLIGEALLLAPDPGAKLRELLR